MSIVLFDNNERQKLYPLNNLCATADLLAGIFTIKERWTNIVSEDVYIHTADYLSVLYEPIPSDVHLWIDASLMPDSSLTDRILGLEEGEALADSKGFIAGKKYLHNPFPVSNPLESFEKIYENDDVQRLEYPWQLFQFNDALIRYDFKYLTSRKHSTALPNDNQYISPENIFIEPRASVHHATINASTGPVYIGKNSTIMEGCLIRGPFAIGENAVLKMGSKIYGATTLGPYCMGGGEMKNVVIQAFSNKAHDGYLGDAAIGSWCNLGAGTSNSNVKNTGGIVSMYCQHKNDSIPVSMKCGIVMGDYSRTAINTSLNTGTLIGTSCNIFGDGLTEKYMQDFQWGLEGKVYEFDKALQHISNWKKMKDKKLTEPERKVLQHIFEQHSGAQ
jgi:UDP-N-acetylglucosamine diphosphorylase/glucosamine-1-phosphate N-acetyltransferase